LTASRILPIAAALAVALFVGMWLGGHPRVLPEPLRSAFVDERIDTVARAQELIEDNYFEEVDAEELRDRSISSMVEYISRRHEDRFSHYFDPETYERFQRANHGRYSGVGLTVSEIDQGLRVAGVFEGSPAEEAGIRERDLIVEVNGQSIAGVSSRVATAEIKGRPGTSVRLTVVRPATRQRREIEGRIPGFTSKFVMNTSEL
jgi:carboxyl-terminal processing protease